MQFCEICHDLYPTLKHIKPLRGVLPNSCGDSNSSWLVVMLFRPPSQIQQNTTCTCWSQRSFTDGKTKHLATFRFWEQSSSQTFTAGLNKPRLSHMIAILQSPKCELLFISISTFLGFYEPLLHFYVEWAVAGHPELIGMNCFLVWTRNRVPCHKIDPCVQHAKYLQFWATCLAI